NTCLGLTPASSSSFYVGTTNASAYVYFDRLKTYYTTGHSDFTLKFDESSIWEVDDVGSGETHDIHEGMVIRDADTHKFSIETTKSESKDISRYDLYAETSLSFDFKRGDDRDAGWVYWSISNDYYTGSLDDLRFYDFTLTPETVDDLYRRNYKSLLLEFDEPPGEDIFSDDSGNYFQATCDFNAGLCPDSGLP
ncbi:MAG: hypothetical protein GY869_27505, partial [Planctomycetes bacterium]|nr:hypothetical protein [Planctomycetota bacterium]